jgi:hypothetical protein
VARGVDRAVELDERWVMSGLKVVATPDVKVAQSYGSEGLVLERRLVVVVVAGRARLNSNDPNPSDAKNGVSPRHPLPWNLYVRQDRLQ